MIIDISSCGPIYCQGRPKSNSKNLKQNKKSPKLEITQKFILLISQASLHVPWCFIHQKNSRALLITWLKGYSVIFTYDREISNQSGNTNRGTPCRFTNLCNVHIVEKLPTKKGEGVNISILLLMSHTQKHSHGFFSSSCTSLLFRFRSTMRRRRDRIGLRFHHYLNLNALSILATSLPLPHHRACHVCAVLLVSSSARVTGGKVGKSHAEKMQSHLRRRPLVQSTHSDLQCERISSMY